jgi:circadian clock protein KaiB
MMSAPLDARLGRPGGQRAAYELPRGVLTLYVSGASELSARAIANARALCDVSLEGRYRLTIVDVNEDPAAALRSGVIAAPTLVRSLPLPERRLVGDLSSTDKVLQTLELPSPGAPAGPAAGDPMPRPPTPSGAP